MVRIKCVSLCTSGQPQQAPTKGRRRNIKNNWPSIPDRQASSNVTPSCRKAVPLFSLFARDINSFECYRAAHEADCRPRTASQARVSWRNHSVTPMHASIEAIRFRRVQCKGKSLSVLVSMMLPRDLIFRNSRTHMLLSGLFFYENQPIYE